MFLVLSSRPTATMQYVSNLILAIIIMYYYIICYNVYDLVLTQIQ